ncbi:MAG: glycosyltransferase family 2 protein [Chitinophagaceae bacterium]|nr:MAG: glycosyltransferase family 2 protein [Chitinophagaceae bacterium]
MILEGCIKQFCTESGNQMSNSFGLLVPCYNAAKFVEEFMQNLSRLDRKFDEVLFYDDASTDNTATIIERFGHKVIRGKQNLGPSSARNILASHCSCTWFHFHDIDDFMRADYVSKVAEAVSAFQPDVILCNVEWLNEKKDEVEISWMYSNKEMNEHPLSYTITHPIGGINGLYRKDAFSAIGGFDEKFRLWEDSDLHVRLAANSAKFYVIEEVLSYSVRYSDSLSVDQRKAWLSRLNLLQLYAKRYKDRNAQYSIGLEGQKAAIALVSYGCLNEAKSALQLSEACNVPVPVSNSKLWRILKPLPNAFRIALRLFQLRVVLKRVEF